MKKARAEPVPPVIPRLLLRRAAPEESQTPVPQDAPSEIPPEELFEEALGRTNRNGLGPGNREE